MVWCKIWYLCDPRYISTIIRVTLINITIIALDNTFTVFFQTIVSNTPYLSPLPLIHENDSIYVFIEPVVPLPCPYRLPAWPSSPPCWRSQWRRTSGWRRCSLRPQVSRWLSGAPSPGRASGEAVVAGTGDSTRCLGGRLLLSSPSGVERRRRGRGTRGPRRAPMFVLSLASVAWSLEAIVRIWNIYGDWIIHFRKACGTLENGWLQGRNLVDGVI